MFKVSLVDTASGMLMRAQLGLVAGLTPAWARVGQQAVESIKRNFDVGGRPPWTPLSPVTVAKKGHSTILVDTGTLRDSTEYRLIPHGVEILNDTSYGKVHQEGSGRIPARPWFVLQPEDELNYARILDTFLGRFLI